MKKSVVRRRGCFRLRNLPIDPDQPVVWAIPPTEDTVWYPIDTLGRLGKGRVVRHSKKYVWIKSLDEDDEEDVIKTSKFFPNELAAIEHLDGLIAKCVMKALEEEQINGCGEDTFYEAVGMISQRQELIEELQARLPNAPRISEKKIVWQ